jgi:hypothetical protein
VHLARLKNVRRMPPKPLQEISGRKPVLKNCTTETHTRLCSGSRERAQLARDSLSTSTQVWQGMDRRIEEFAVSNYLQLAA